MTNLQLPRHRARNMIRTFSRFGAILTIVMVTGAPSAWAQSPLPDLSLEDLMKLDAGQVFGASERLQPVIEAPASVSFITAEEIARYGYRTLADILRGVRGMYVTDDRNFSFIGHARVRQAGRLQQPHPAAGQRTPRQRQRLRAGGDRRGVRPRSGDVRARRNHPRAGIVALWRQRVLRRGERHHADGRVARRRLGHGRGRHAGTRLMRADWGASANERLDVALSGTYRAQRRRRAALLSGVRYAGHQQRRRRGARRRGRQTVLRPAGLQGPDRDRRLRQPAAGRADRVVRDAVQRAGNRRSRPPIAYAGRCGVRALVRRHARDVPGLLRPVLLRRDLSVRRRADGDPPDQVAQTGGLGTRWSVGSGLTRAFRAGRP